MRVSSTIVGLVGAVAGVAIAVTGYQHLAAVDARPPSSTTALPAVGRPLPAAPARIRVRLAGCQPPARLEHGACVTTVTRTRVVHDPAPPQPAGLLPDTAPVVAPAPAGTQPTPATRQHAASSPAPAAAPRHEDDHGDDHGGDHGDD